MKNYPCYMKQIGEELWYIEKETNGLSFYYKIKEVIFNEQSQYQHVMILDSFDFGKMLILDGAIQTTSLDGFIYNEMISHIPVNIHPSPKKILIIGGGDCGVARELIKYPQVEHIDVIEIDSTVVNTCLKYLPEVSGNISDARVNFIFKDGINFVENAIKTKNYYDIAIIDSSDPVGPAIPLFSLDFYKSLYHILKNDGVMACQSDSPMFRINVMGGIYKKLCNVFPIVRPYLATIPTYPGGFWSFTLASKLHKTPRPLLFHAEKYGTKYVNKEILEQCFALPQFVKQGLTK
jgi:spermidine synthase